MIWSERKRQRATCSLDPFSFSSPELDWEFTTSDGSEGFTNWFSLGVVDNNNGGTTSISPSVAEWHTIGINWTPSQIQWKLDGSVVRTVKASSLGDKFPSTPARFQMSVWSGGNSTNPEGVIQWAGGPTDWGSAEYKDNGYYTQEIKSFKMTCGDQSAANLQTVGQGTNATSWVYTGENGSDGRPTLQLSTDPITFLKNPSKDGMAGIPGYETGSVDSTKKTNVWDGSGDQQDKEASSSSSGGSSIFSKNAALKYGVPIAAGIVGLIVIWALITWCVRRNRAGKMDQPALGAIGSAVGAKSAASRYQALGGGDDQEGLPMGARRTRGGGIGPAAGPSASSGATRYGNVAPTPSTPNRDMRQNASNGSNSSYRPSYAVSDAKKVLKEAAPKSRQERTSLGR